MVDIGNRKSSTACDDEDVLREVKLEVGDFDLDSLDCPVPIAVCLPSSSENHLKSHFVGMGFSPDLVDKVLQEYGEDNVDLLLDTLFKYSETVAGSSQSHLKSHFLGLGFSPTLVEKVLSENGEENIERLLETLLTYSEPHQLPSPEISDSLKGALNDCQDGSSAEGPKIEEFDVTFEANEDKRASLLMMDFTEQEVEFAINKLGEAAPLNEVIDFILATQITQSPEQDTSDEDIQAVTNDTLFGTMEKTLRLLEMGFSEAEVSSAIDKYGSETPAGKLAESIFANRTADTRFDKKKDNQSHIEDDWNSLGERSKEQNKRRFSETPVVNTKGSSSNGTPLDEDIDFKNMGKGKMPKLEYPEFEDFKNMGKGKMPKHEYPEFEDYSNSSPLPLKDHNKWGGKSMSRLNLPLAHKSCSSSFFQEVLSKPPYFFYGNVMDVSHDTWDKIIKFLYAVAPETANTEHFSALNRKEGYIHNLPKENRFHILPGPPMSIQDAIPHTKKWWPSWDNRKLLSSICPETRGISQLCERLRKILVDSQGMVSKEQQTDIFHHCKTMNLLWVGLYKLGPIEPEHLEHILGYPLNHTQVGCDLMERLSSLKHCFQTDALGFHLSSLKWKFPEGLTVLSLYSGIGGAEVALHRLGLRLKCVVSVETSETNRRILKRWWGNTQQTGELVQIDDIGKLSGKKLDNLIEEFGGFDFVICQNPSAYNSGTSKVNVPDVNSTGIDFSLFYEFVRVLQHVRSTMALR